jgi:YVTN family beta-propeller protein
VPVDLAAGTAGTPIPVGGPPRVMAVTPGGGTVYTGVFATVVAISTATDTAGKRYNVYDRPTVIAVTPDGKRVYVGDQGDSVTAINTVTGKPERPVHVYGNGTGAIVFTPDSKTAYILGSAYPDNAVTIMATGPNTIQADIQFAGHTQAMAITPDGTAVYVAVNDGGYGGADEVVPVSTVTNTAGTPIPVLGSPAAIAITPARCWGR